MLHPAPASFLEDGATEQIEQGEGMRPAALALLPMLCSLQAVTMKRGGAAEATTAGLIPPLLLGGGGAGRGGAGLDAVGG